MKVTYGETTMYCKNSSIQEIHESIVGFFLS